MKTKSGKDLTLKPDGSILAMFYTQSGKANPTVYLPDVASLMVEQCRKSNHDGACYCPITPEDFNELEKYFKLDREPAKA